MATQLPNDDPDLILARQVGQALREGRSPESVDNPLIQELSAFRSRQYQKTDIQRAHSKQLWDRITKEIEQDSTSIPISVLKPKIMRWAAAATIMIAALVGTVYFQHLRGPELIAESGKLIENVQLSDGSEVTLRPHTKLHLLSKTENRSYYQLSGEAYFEVTSDPSRTFEVKAGNGRVRVLGTTFTVSSWGERTQVFLEEGSVRFENIESTASITLEPGQAASVSKTQTQPVLTEGDTEEYTDWLQQELVFKNKPAARIFDEIEQHYSITITAPDTVLNTSLSGSLSLKDQEAALSNLGLSLGGEFNQTDVQTFTFTPDDE